MHIYLGIALTKGDRIPLLAAASNPSLEPIGRFSTETGPTQVARILFVRQVPD